MAKVGGGSPYWIIDTSEKIGWTSGVVTALLFWATGQWERGVRWPRRWMAITNRGLRGMNLKVVVLRRSWWRSFFSSLGFLFPYSSFRAFPGSSFQYVEVSERRPTSTKYVYREGHQMRGLRLEDVAPGGDFIKLLLLPKPFSPEFRENWELYRTEYWEHENERRGQLRLVVRQRQQEIAKEQGGWLWWTGWRGWRGRRRQQYPDIPSNLDPGKMLLHNPQLQQQHQRQSSTSARRRRQSTASQQRDLQQHSRSSSRASTGTVEADDSRLGSVSAGEKERRGHRRSKLSGEIASVRRSRRSEGLPPIEPEHDSLEETGPGPSWKPGIERNPLMENVSEEA